MTFVSLDCGSKPTQAPVCFLVCMFFYRLMYITAYRLLCNTSLCSWNFDCGSILAVCCVVTLSFVCSPRLSDLCFWSGCIFPHNQRMVWKEKPAALKVMTVCSSFFIYFYWINGNNLNHRQSSDRDRDQRWTGLSFKFEGLDQRWACLRWRWSNNEGIKFLMFLLNVRFHTYQRWLGWCSCFPVFLVIIS